MKTSKEKPKSSWKRVYAAKHQFYVTTTPIDLTKDVDERIVHVDDLEKRKEAYGICGECNEPGTGEKWCRPCNAKRFKENFKNWTSGNKDIDEFIQRSQTNAVHHKKCLEWIPFEKFQEVKYITRGGFGKIFSAIWPEGFICYWDIENQKWFRETDVKVALKSLDNSSSINADFLSEIDSHLQIYFWDIIQCYGITQEPDTKDYMMVLKFCDDGNLRSYLSKFKKNYLRYGFKIRKLSLIARGLLDIHNVGKVHKDFHSGNILFINSDPYISDLGMCQPVNNKGQSVKEEGMYGVLPYMAPEVLRGNKYTEKADIYSFGIIMNEFISEEIPYHDISHDQALAVKICKGLRPKIPEETPKLIADLIMKCWDADPENRPTAKELYHILKKWDNECDSSDGEDDIDSEIYSQVKECERIIELKKNSSKNKFGNIQTHPQAFYTSRLLSFKGLPKPENSSDLSGAIASASVNLISDAIDCLLDESDLKETDQK